MCSLPEGVMEETDDRKSRRQSALSPRFMDVEGFSVCGIINVIVVVTYLIR